MDSKEELAQPVGNAKIRGEFDTDAATVVGPNTNDAVLFPRSRSDQDGNMTGLSLTGTVLAKRYKILEMIDGDSFKAHDLALDQTVTVRQATPTSPRDVDAWRQKVQRLVFVRNPNFLNVLDVVFDKSSGFVITEHARGRSIGELLRERSRFDPEDALALMTPLAGALDLAASFACSPNLVSARWLFAEKRHSFAADAEQPRLSEWASSFVTMDVWEFVRPRKGIKWPLPTSKAQSGDSRKLAVEQAALLTYELLGGQKENRRRELKRWFEPINGLSDAGNAVLYRGLEGSPVFESSGDFFHKFESAIQSVSLESRALPGPALPTRGNSVSLPGTSDVIREFNRDTRWLATGVLGVLVFAASLLAVLVPEHHPSAVDPTAAVQPPGNLLLNPNNSTLFKQVGVRGKSSAGETTPDQAKSVDQVWQDHARSIGLKAQPAEKMADLAASQRSTLESELKKAEDRAQLAQQNADLAASQRKAMASELSKAEDRAQLAEKNADLATRQRTAQEAELKKAQEKAQLAQQNADLAAGQLTALETQLKKAQEKAQLAEKNADLVAGQFHAEESRIQNGEPPQKSDDLSANQPKSAQTQPPNTDLKPEPVSSTQPVDSSVQPAQTTQRSGLAPVRVQAVADTPGEANKGIGFTEATAPIAVRASPAPINEPATRDQEEGKFAQATPVQAAVPVPIPSVHVSPESSPSRAPTDRSVKASVDEQSLKEFVLGYIRTVASNDIATQDRFFEHRVNYYGRGVLALPEVHASIDRYHREWPIRDWEPQGEPEFPKLLHSVNPKLYEVLQPFTWTLSNGPLHAQGGATLYVKVWKNDKGEFHIVHVEQRNPGSQSQNI